MAGRAAPRQARRLVVVVAVISVVGLVGVGVVGEPPAPRPAAVELLDIVEDLLRFVAQLGLLGLVERSDLFELGVQGAREYILGVLDANERP